MQFGSHLDEARSDGISPCPESRSGGEAGWIAATAHWGYGSSMSGGEGAPPASVRRERGVAAVIWDPLHFATKLEYLL